MIDWLMNFNLTMRSSSLEGQIHACKHETSLNIYIIWTAKFNKLYKCDSNHLQLGANSNSLSVYKLQVGLINIHKTTQSTLGMFEDAFTYRWVTLRVLAAFWSHARANPLNHMRIIGNTMHTGSIHFRHPCFALKKLPVIVCKQLREKTIAW